MSKYEDEDEIHWSDDEEKLFDSPIPSQSKDTPASSNGRASEPQSKTRGGGGGQGQIHQLDAEEAREAALQQELENVRKINAVIEGVVESLERARGNMDTVSQTVTSASTLLTTYSRILSQTEHNQRLILNPAWQGASADLSEIEAEEERRARDAQRRQFEEAARREALARKAEEDARRREEAAARGSRGTKGRARGRVASSGYGRQTPTAGASRGGASVSSSRGTGTGVGRGTRGTRGRGT